MLGVLAVVGGIGVVVVYAGLLLLEKLVNWKAGTDRSEERMRAIIEAYEAEKPPEGEAEGAPEAEGAD